MFALRSVRDEQASEEGAEMREFRKGDRVCTRGFAFDESDGSAVCVEEHRFEVALVREGRIHLRSDKGYYVVTPSQCRRLRLKPKARREWVFVGLHDGSPLLMYGDKLKMDERIHVREVLPRKAVARG